MDDTNNPMAALYEALAKAQGEFPEIPKNRTVNIRTKTGGSFEFKYADLQEIISKTKPALSKYGLSFSQLLNTISRPAGEGEVMLVNQLTTKLHHNKGAYLMSTVDLPQSSDPDPKTLGGNITYYRRYAFAAIIGVAADDDLDARDTGNKDTGGVDEKAIEEMTGFAQQGTAVYKKYWVSLTDAQRSERKALHPGMKRVAAKADAAAKEESDKKAAEEQP